MTEKAPPCAFCGKPLHRRMDNGMAKKSDSWAWCRNQKCEKYNLPQAETRFKSIAQVKLEPVKTPSVEDAIAAALTGLVPEPEPTEPQVVIDTRARIKTAFVTIEQTYSRSVVGLAMAIVAQEMGSFDVANMLIDEYDLAKSYGIAKRKK